MLNSYLPSIDSVHSDAEGDRFVVIGTGTNGVVIEYSDGRVELVPKPDWRSLSQQSTPAEITSIR